MAKKKDHILNSRKKFQIKLQKDVKTDLNHQEKHAGNSDLLNSGGVNNIFNSIIKEFSVIRKSDGLITGTNQVLRLLKKEKLIAIFLFKDKVSYLLKDSIHMLCTKAVVPLVWLEDKDRLILGPDFPKSIAYGIKKEPSSTLESLRNLLLKLTAKRIKDIKKDSISLTDISSHKRKLLSDEEIRNQEVLDAYTFYHIHEGHISKKLNCKDTGFLSLNTFLSDKKETDFLDYDSVASSGVLSIK